MTAPIRIRHHVTEGGKCGYRWTCRRCDASGLHRFDRWTDQLLVRRGRPAAHPWQRCLVSAAFHLRHRCPGRQS